MDSDKRRFSYFWITIVISFVLVVHNGTEPQFILALSLLPVLLMLFIFKKSSIPIVFYLIIFGIVGRYTRYYRETYASDALLAIRDYVGYFLAGKNPYKEIIWAQKGLTPFTYLPFSLYWYLPAYILGLDLRFFEMVISATVPIFFYLYSRLTNVWVNLPVLAVIALTPFLLDLSSDGSNDNSAIVLLLLSIIFLISAIQKKSSRRWYISAVLLALASSFKHYVWFYLPYFGIFLRQMKSTHHISARHYVRVFIMTVSIVALPFIIAAPEGFYRSLSFIEIGNYHTTWGWNIWVALRDGFHIEASKQTMWLVRTVGTACLMLGLLRSFRYNSLRQVLLASSLTMFTYLLLSNWTTYAYFTFLVPILGLCSITYDEV